MVLKSIGGFSDRWIFFPINDTGSEVKKEFFDRSPIFSKITQKFRQFILKFEDYKVSANALSC